MLTQKYCISICYSYSANFFLSYLNVFETLNRCFIFQFHQKLHPFYNTKFHMIRVPGIIDNSPNVIKGDKVVLFKRSKQFNMTVEDILGEMVFSFLNFFINSFLKSGLNFNRVIELKLLFYYFKFIVT